LPKSMPIACSFMGSLLAHPYTHLRSKAADHPISYDMCPFQFWPGCSAKATKDRNKPNHLQGGGGRTGPLLAPKHGAAQDRAVLCSICDHEVHDDNRSFGGAHQ
jgi:hypothetical protein